MIDVERKIKHLNFLKREAASLEERISSMEKEISSDMINAYSYVNNN